MKIKSMKRIFFIMLTPLMIGMSSCSTYSFVAKVGMESLSSKTKVNNHDLIAEKEGITLSYNLKQHELLVMNTSDKTIVIDKSKSFSIDNNGLSESLFSNSVTTYSTSHNKGASVNLGAVTNAIGVGGIIGTLAQGVNVGGGTTNGVSTQYYEQQYVVIPPYASSTINLFTSKSAGHYRVGGEQSYSKVYTSQTSPYKKQYVISFAFVEDDNTPPSFEIERSLFYIQKESFRKSRSKKDVLSFETDMNDKNTYSGYESDNNAYGAMVGACAVATIGGVVMMAVDAPVGAKVGGGFISAAGVAGVIGGSVIVARDQKKYNFYVSF